MPGPPSARTASAGPWLIASTVRREHGHAGEGRHRPGDDVIRYCTRCVMPETKPDILFDDRGVCSACRNFERRVEVDWDARMQELQDVLARYRSPDRSNYDCIIPVSG